MKKLSCILASFFFAFIVTAWGAIEDKPVGLIDSIAGQTDKVIIEHGSDHLTPVPGFPLFAGDKISVSDEGTKVRISLTGKTELLEIKKDNCQQLGLIQDTVPPPTVVGNMMSWIGKMATSGNQKKTIKARTRGAAPKIELAAFKDNKGRAIAGEKDWLISWDGGSSPYCLSLKRVEGDQLVTVFEKSGLEGTTVTLTGLKLDQGQYHIVINGGATKTVATLTLVSKINLPPIPSELRDIVLQENLKKMLYTVWLYQDNQDEWSFEAMQQAFTASRDYPPANGVLHAIENGETIPSSKAM